MLALALRRPGRVLAVGLALAVIGWALDSQTKVVSDVEKLVPQDLPAVQDLQALQKATGVAGEVDVVVEGDDLTDPKVVEWMRDYQAGLLKKYGYSATNGCGKAELCPALSLTDLFRDQSASTSQKQVRALLDAVPPYFSQAVITKDRKTANLAFGVRLVSLERQQEIFDDMRERLKPPDGRAGRARRAAGGGGRRQRHAVGPAAPAGDAAGRAARRGAGAARRLPALGARAGAAGADRARHWLVGAGAVRDARAAEPDVGDARVRS